MKTLIFGIPANDHIIIMFSITKTDVFLAFHLNFSGLPPQHGLFFDLLLLGRDDVPRLVVGPHGLLFSRHGLLEGRLQRLHRDLSVGPPLGCFTNWAKLWHNLSYLSSIDLLTFCKVSMISTTRTIWVTPKFGCPKHAVLC